MSPIASYRNGPASVRGFIPTGETYAVDIPFDGPIIRPLPSFRGGGSPVIPGLRLQPMHSSNTWQPSKVGVATQFAAAADVGGATHAAEMVRPLLARASTSAVETRPSVKPPSSTSSSALRPSYQQRSIAAMPLPASAPAASVTSVHPSRAVTEPPSMLYATATPFKRQAPGELQESFLVPVGRTEDGGIIWRRRASVIASLDGGGGVAALQPSASSSATASASSSVKPRALGTKLTAAGSPPAASKVSSAPAVEAAKTGDASKPRHCRRGSPLSAAGGINIIESSRLISGRRRSIPSSGAGTGANVITAAPSTSRKGVSSITPTGSLFRRRVKELPDAATGAVGANNSANAATPAETAAGASSPATRTDEGPLKTASSTQRPRRGSAAERMQEDILTKLTRNSERFAAERVSKSGQRPAVADYAADGTLAGIASGNITGEESEAPLRLSGSSRLLSRSSSRQWVPPTTPILIKCAVDSNSSLLPRRYADVVGEGFRRFLRGNADAAQEDDGFEVSSAVGLSAANSASSNDLTGSGTGSIAGRGGTSAASCVSRHSSRAFSYDLGRGPSARGQRSPSPTAVRAASVSSVSSQIEHGQRLQLALPVDDDANQQQEGDQEQMQPLYTVDRTPVSGVSFISLSSTTTPLHRRRRRCSGGLLTSGDAGATEQSFSFSSASGKPGPPQPCGVVSTDELAGMEPFVPSLRYSTATAAQSSTNGHSSSVSQHSSSGNGRSNPHLKSPPTAAEVAAAAREEERASKQRQEAMLRAAAILGRSLAAGRR